MSLLLSAFILVSLLLTGNIATGQQVNSTDNDLPKYDLHVHLSTRLPIQQRYADAAALSKKKGVTFGIAEEVETPDIKSNNGAINTRLYVGRNYPVYIGMQVNMAGWTKLYSKEVIDKLDYVMCDALFFPYEGKTIMLWTQAADVLKDPEDFMNRYVAYTLKVFEEPIDIWVNPTYLPKQFVMMYDKLWTDERMKIIIDAAVKKNIAIEINSVSEIPSKKFILMAKAAGAHFTFGSNQHGTEVGNIDWCLKIAKECGLKRSDFFIPARKLN